MADITNIFHGAFRAPERRRVDPPEVQLAQAMMDVGLTPPDHIVMDGRVHRFKSGTSGKGGAGDRSGWYVAFADGIAAGRFGCWRAGVEATWRAETERDLSPADEMALARRMAEASAARDAERRRTQEHAADTVAVIWEGCTHASQDHPYLTRKGVQPHGARVTGDGRLVVPLYDEHGSMTSLQYIAHDGAKLYHSGGKTGGSFWSIGRIDASGPVYIAEGFATAATVHEATGRPCVIAYSASNLVPVTGAWRERLGAMADLVVVADNDASGTGQKYADQCAAKYGARVILPPEPGDVNDYRASGGDVAALLSPQPAGQAWLIQADEFSSQPAPIRWLVKGWLQQESLIMIHGPSGGGKTFVLLEWLLTIAAGRTEWNGRKVRPGAVVYLAGEGHAGLRGRTAGWKQARGVKALQMWISSTGCDLNTPAGYQQAVSEIKRIGVVPAVIAVDTLHRFLAGDENSAQDAKTMLDACALLMREFGCTVVLVHHTGVSEEAQHRARGSSAWRGALEIEISVVPGNDERPMEIIQRKAKDSELAEPLYCRLVSQPIEGWLDEDGDQVTTAVLEMEDAPPSKEAAKDSKHAKHIKMLEAAWWHSGAEASQGAPYISRSGFMDYLVSSLGTSQSTAKTYAKPGAAGRPVNDLLVAGTIGHHEHGWIVLDSVLSSAWMMAKNGKK